MTGLAARSKKLLAGIWPVAVPVCLVLLVVAVASQGGAPTDRVVLSGVINLILVVGLYIFVGNSGILSFGHMAFMAVGAYTSALLTISPATKGVLMPDLPGFLADAHTGPVPAALIGGGLAAVFAFLFAVPTMRLVGIAAGIATFSFLTIVQNVLSSTPDWFGQSGAIIGVSSDATIWSACFGAVVAMIIAYVFQRSRTGQRLRASRDDEVAARGLGIRVVPERIVAFVVSAFVVGVGGAYYAHFVGSFSPNAFYISITFLTIAMLVVGGSRSLLGAVVGVLAISMVAEFLRRVEGGVDLGLFSIPSRPGLREVGLAAVMLLALIFRPRGLTGGREARWPWGEPTDSALQAQASQSSRDSELQGVATAPLPSSAEQE